LVWLCSLTPVERCQISMPCMPEIIIIQNIEIYKNEETE
jgi:hypothetical protein